ncbi:MAG: SPOR domain-containing protein [Gammaproteobacteria bacterium]
MDILLKQRLVGAIVLISLAVIFLPMLFTGPDEEEQKFESSIPAEPVYEIKSPQVSVPLPLPSPALEKVPLSEPVIKEEIAQAKTESPTEPQKSATQPTKQEAKQQSQQPKQQSTQRPDSQNKPPAELAPAVAVAKPVPEPARAAKEASTPPTPAIKPSNVTGWVVQVGSFSQKANAEKLRDKLRKMGMASFVATGTSNGKKVYRVRVGPEIDRADAEKTKAKIKEQTKLNGLVMKYP